MRVRWILTALAVIVALIRAPTLAQEASPSPLDDLREWTGLQQMVSRSWGPNFEAWPTPESPDASPVPLSGLVVLTGMIAEFDTPEHAGAVFDQFVANPDPMESTSPNPDVTVETVSDTPEGIGERATAITTSSHNPKDDVPWSYSRTVVSIKGNVLFLVIGMSFPEPTLEQVDALAAYLGNEGAASDDAVDFHDDGTSTGGLWGYFPPDDHASVANLVPMLDETIYPPANATYWIPHIRS